MESILLHLYEGRICPSQTYKPLGCEYKKIAEQYEKDYDELVNLLKSYDPTLVRKFNNLIDEQATLLPYEVSSSFISGFRLGARMICEVFDDN